MITGILIFTIVTSSGIIILSFHIIKILIINCDPISMNSTEKITAKVGHLHYLLYRGMYRCM